MAMIPTTYTGTLTSVVMRQKLIGTHSLSRAKTRDSTHRLANQRASNKHPTTHQPNTNTNTKQTQCRPRPRTTASGGSTLGALVVIGALRARRGSRHCWHVGAVPRSLLGRPCRSRRASRALTRRCDSRVQWRGRPVRCPSSAAAEPTVVAHAGSTLATSRRRADQNLSSGGGGTSAQTLLILFSTETLRQDRRGGLAM